MPAMYETAATTSILVWPTTPSWPAPALQQSGKEASTSGQSSEQAGAGGAGEGPPAKAAASTSHSDDSDVPVVDYKLQQTVKVRFKVRMRVCSLQGLPLSACLHANSYKDASIQCLNLMWTASLSSPMPPCVAGVTAVRTFG